MKKILLPLMVVAITLGLYEQAQDRPNVYILVVTFMVFMFGMMRLSAKTLHYTKRDENHIEETEDYKEEDNDNKGR